MMGRHVTRRAFAFLAVFFLITPAFAGEEIIWEYRDDIPDDLLDPADDPTDPLYETFKAKREIREKAERIRKTLAEGRYSDAVGGIFRDCPGCPEMVVIPAGSFRMGNLSVGGDDDEKPVHQVTIPRVFAVGKYEVTQAEWEAVMGSNPSRFKGSRNPVEGVSWDDARAFVRRLSAKTAKRYRLLSEAEWEYAARAGTATKYSWGNGFDSNRASNNQNNTVPVGGYAPNAFGLYDMHGNVWEWVEDCWHDSYNGAPTDGGAWASGGGCSRRVLRGGSWDYRPRDLRSANRRRDATDFRDDLNGFRIARTL